MTTQQHILDFYARPAAMTSAGTHAPLFDFGLHSLTSLPG
jgi:hypothetical protein